MYLKKQDWGQTFLIRYQYITLRVIAYVGLLSIGIVTAQQKSVAKLDRCYLFLCVLLHKNVNVIITSGCI